MTFSIFTELSITTLNARVYSSPPKETPTLRQSFPLPHPPLSKALAGTNVLPVPTDCLFWTFHVNGIMQYEWLLSHTSHFHTRSPPSQDNPATPTPCLASSAPAKAKLLLEKGPMNMERNTWSLVHSMGHPSSHTRPFQHTVGFLPVWG